MAECEQRGVIRILLFFSVFPILPELSFTLMTNCVTITKMNLPKFIWYLLTAACSLIAVADAISHPHVFIISRVDAIFDDKGMAGFHIQWIFDEFFSNMIMEEYDQNQNAVLGKEEVAKIKKEAFDYLAEQDYFVFVKIDNTPFKVQFVRDFSASFAEGKLCYRFLVPCHVTALKSSKTLRISIYDPTYYSAIFFAETQPVTIENGDGIHVTHHIAQNMEETYYFGLAHPWELTLNFRLNHE
jgi:ABC-type uncharacterized transport system substrate-binding protein